MSGPYRGVSERDVVTAPTRDGDARLEIDPDTIRLSLGDRWRATITRRFVALERPDHGRRGSLKLENERVVAARAHPAGGAGLWCEEPFPGMRRLAGLRPVQILDTASLEAARTLERLSARLRAALRAHAPALRDATEYGRGYHRVLLVEEERRLQLFARPLFRKSPRLALETRPGGETVTYRRTGRERRAHCGAREVVVGGDLLRFVDARGEDCAHLALPWISPADREELARRVHAHLSAEPA